MKFRYSSFGEKRPVATLSLAILFFCLALAGCGKTEPDIDPGMRMASMLLSRSNIGEVGTFREKNHLHGLSFFHFHASGDDADRIVGWLKMKEQSRVPPLLVDRVLAASTGTDWKFKWDGARVYVTFYCHPFDGTYGSIDMLLVANEEAVFVTEGYLPPGSAVTNDPASCEIGKN